MSQKLDGWIEGMIDSCKPGAGRVTAAEQQLVEAVAFLEGRRPMIFGMAADTSRVADAGALRRRALDALRAWMDGYAASGDHHSCTVMIEMAARRGVALEAELPASMQARVRLELDIDRRLAALPSPNAALRKLLPGVANAVAELPGDLDESLLAKNGKLIVPGPPAGGAGEPLRDFEWAEDDWAELPDRPIDPSFYVLGGGENHRLGLYLDGPSIALGLEPPVVYASLGESAPLGWVAESASHLEDMVSAAVRNKGKYRAPKVEEARGRRHPTVEAALARRSQGGDEARLLGAYLAAETRAAREAAANELRSAYEAAGHAFALASLDAQILLGARRAGVT